MPFNSKTASVAGKKGGSKTKDPANKRSEQISLRTTPEEKNIINEKAAAIGLSRNDFIIKAALEYKVM